MPQKSSLACMKRHIMLVYIFMLLFFVCLLLLLPLTLHTFFLFCLRRGLFKAHNFKFTDCRREKEILDRFKQFYLHAISVFMLVVATLLLLLGGVE